MVVQKKIQTALIGRIFSLMYGPEHKRIPAFSKRTGIADRVIRSWIERDSAWISSDHLLKISQSYGVSLDWLLKGDEITLPKRSIPLYDWNDIAHTGLVGDYMADVSLEGDLFAVKLPSECFMMMPVIPRGQRSLYDRIKPLPTAISC